VGKRIRIRFLYTRYPHWCSRSGFMQITRHLGGRFYPILDGAADEGSDLPKCLAGLERWLRKRVAGGSMPWYKVNDFLAELRALPGSMGGRYDVIHFLDGEHSGRYLPRLLRRLSWLRPHMVASFHQPHDLARTLIDPETVRRFDHVTVFSPSQVALFREWLPAERIHLIPHGIDTSFFHPPYTRHRGNNMRCVTVGHWLRDWSVMRGVACAFLDDPRVQFDVVTSRETGLEGLGNVVHHRSIPDAELAELYRKADVLLLPLTESTANNALLEGMASGLPVISTALAGTCFHVGRAPCVLAPVGDTKAYIDAVSALQNDPDRRLEMGKEARRRAEELCWVNVARRFAALYEGMARGESGGEISQRMQKLLSDGEA